jgi:hypothetical protein
MKNASFATAAIAMLCAALMPGAPAHAGSVTTFSGQDDGSEVGLPLFSYVNSNAALLSFLATLNTYGVETRNGFGGVTNAFPDVGTGWGFHDLQFSYQSNPTAAVKYVATSPNAGINRSGVNTTTLGNLYGFGVGTSNDAWLGFPRGAATFDFVNPTHAFGMWLTGLQGSRFGTVVSITFTDADGVLHVLSPTNNTNGGAQFFGFADTAAFMSLTISATGTDAWGIDNVSFNVPTPLPAALSLFTGGLGALGLLGWRRKKRARLAIAT